MQYLHDLLLKRSEVVGSCWIWQGSRISRGYGNIRYKGKNIYAHRASWEVFFGPIPKGLLVLHECDTPECINPMHLFLGTHQDNVDDMITKNRDPYQFGFKLTHEHVGEIKFLLEEGSLQQKTVAEIYGVSCVTISNIKSGATWRKIACQTL